MTIELARRLEPQTISEMRALAADAVASKFFAVRSPEEALVILMTGHELGLRPMQSLRGIYVVNGKPVLSADMLVAAVRASGACESWRVVVTTAERCEIHTRRKGESTDEIGVWTKADAERAGVYRKAGPWQQYPDRMLRHRTASDLARRVFPDVCLGVYVQGELDDDAPQPVTVTHATPLDYLRDDLASASTPEGIRESYRAHARDIAEMDEDGDALRLARNACHEAVTKHGFGTTKADTDRILGKPAPVAAQPAPAEREAPAPAPQSDAGEVDWRARNLADLPSDSSTTTALLASLRSARDGAEILARWREAEPSVNDLPGSEATGCRDAAISRWAQLMKTTNYETAAHAFGEALKSPPDGPKPGRKPATKPAADAQGSSAEAAPSAGPQARAPHPESAPYVAADGAEAWAARVARYTNTIELRRSYERHAPAFRAAGVLEARRAVSVARLQALASIDDEAVAQRVLDDAERAADAAARVTSTARRTGRSEVTVRREARDAAERTLRKVA